MKFQLLLLIVFLFLFSCGDDSAGTISETDIGIMGTIVTEDGVASSDVQVVAFLVSDDTAGIPVDTTVTSESGVYTFDSLTSGTYRLAGTKKIDTLTYTALIDEFDYDSINFSDTVLNIGVDTLYAPGAVSGVVQLQGSSFHLGVDLFIPGTSFIGKSDTDGVFIISGIPEGDEYQLAAMFPGYQTAFSKTFSITKNVTTPLDSVIHLEFDPTKTPSAPTGVHASFNSATKVVTVQWDSVLHPNWKGFVVYRKDSALSAADPEVVSGEHLLTATAFTEVITDFDPTKNTTLQYQVKTQDLTGNRSGFSDAAYIRLKESQEGGKSTIVGRVVSSDGVALSAASVVLHHIDSAEVSVPVDTVITDMAGAFLFSDIPTGTYYIGSFAEVHGTELLSHSALFAFDSLFSVSVPYDCGVDTLWEAGAIEGIVTSTSVTNLSGVQLYLPGTSYSARTDSAGRYHISGVAKGIYELNIDYEGQAEIVIDSIVVTPGKTVLIAPIELKAIDIDSLTAPTGVNFVLSGSNATISWSAVKYSALAGYSVYRKESGQSDAELELISGSEPMEALSFVDDLATMPAGTYQYRLLAQSVSGEKSDLSAPVLVTWNGAPDPVTVLSPLLGTTGLNSEIAVTWVQNTDESYTLQLSTENTFTTIFEEISTASSPQKVHGLELGTTYYVRVNAKNSFGETAGETSTFSTKESSLREPMMKRVPDGTVKDSDKRYGFVSSFLMMEHEVTVEMYRLFESDYMNLLGASKPKHPVASVSWGDAIRFANWLSEQNGLTPCYTLVPGKFKRTDWSDPQNENCKWPHDTLFYEFDTTANGYRLPTSDEWQYAASGGDEYDYEYATKDGTIDSTKAWNDSWDTPSEIKQFDPNPLGLYDMSCNTWEMVWGMISRSPEGRKNYVAPADSANQQGVKMGDGFYGGEGKYALPITRREEWYDTYGYQYECGFRLARSIKY